jgi:hypothetical protein
MHDFADLLRDYLAELSDLRQRGASEDSVRDAFLRFLRAAFPRLQQADPILLEKHIPGMRVRGGFADALYGDLIFECKKRLDEHNRAEGQDELSRYIGNQERPQHHLGILTDGEQLEVYALRDERLDKVDQLRLAVPEADHAHTWLDCHLFHEKHLTPTANDVALRFGEHSPSFFRSYHILEELWQQIGKQPAVQTKFAAWQSLLSIVYGSQVGDESLFLRHTYLALFARVLAFVALEHRAPDAVEVPGIITGATFERMGFENFIDDDFFTWISDVPVAAPTRNMLLAVATRLAAAYDLDAIREDLLKELYQELVDPQTRHDLGEFYTPDWLAELTLRKAGFPGEKSSRVEPSLLDPSCGSGTFLFIAVRLLREAGWKGKEVVEFCSRCLAGIDVHPLAVTIAKTNVLLALGKDVKGLSRRITLPIYMADTLSSAKPALQENVVRVPVDVDTIAARAEKPKRRSLPKEFDLPADLANTPELLYDTLSALLRFADPRISDADAAEAFGSRLESLGVANGGNYIWRGNLTLMRWLLAPPATDSVWRFVLRNAYQPELLARRKFAFVVGNPPWLSYRYIKRADYQERVRQLVFDYGLLAKKQANLFTQMELATLFFAFSADRYLAHGGTLAFVMPRSVLTGAKQHAAFRQQFVAGANYVIDCQQVAPLFKVPACVIIREDRHGRRKRTRVPQLCLQGHLPQKNVGLAEATQYFRQVDSLFAVPTTVPGSAYLSSVIQGSTIVPRALWFVRTPTIARVVDRRSPQLETDPSIERQAKAPWKGIRQTGCVEAEFLFASLLCEQMLPFGWRRLSLTVLPVVQDEACTVRLVNQREAMRRGKAGLADWLGQAEATWKRHAKTSKRVRSIYDRFDFGQCLTRQHARGVLKVLHNDAGTHVCSCVVDARNAGWDLYHVRANGFIAEHVTYWLETEDAVEAHYLCAVLNAPLVDKAIKPYQTRGAFGAQRGKGERHVGRRPFEVLPIPQYNSKDKRHRELAKSSERCHAKVAEVVADADEKWLKGPIGRIRTELREGFLKDDLAEIDALVAEILKQA